LPVRIAAKLARLLRKRAGFAFPTVVGVCKTAAKVGSFAVCFATCRAWAANLSDDASTKYALKGLTAFSVPLLPKPKDDNDFATIVGLRNSDVHDKTIVPHRREVQLHGHSMTATSGHLGVVIRQADGTEETRRLPAEATPELTQPEPTPVPTVEYFIDPGELSKQPDFMVDGSGKPYAKKADVLNHLKTKPLRAIAQDCLATLNQLLADAENNGYIRRS
jgi:hypothetical protein